MRRLAAVCPRAAALGLRPDQALTEARAMCPDLVIADADPAGDAASLVRLAAWCERYTPLAAADPPDGLWLDITGCAHLLGPSDCPTDAETDSEPRLAADLRARLARAGLDCRVAVAATAGAAWALARSATARDACTVLPAGQEHAGLSRLPVALLRLDPRTVAGLRRVGLRSIGEMTRLPRGELAAQYGAATLLRLDQAHGRTAEAIVWPHPPHPWAERLAFAEPIGTPDDLFRALNILAGRLCTRLAEQDSGAQRFAATFFRVDNQRPCIEIATARPVRDPAYVAKLLGAKLETVDPGFGVETMALTADLVETVARAQGRLAAHAASRGDMPRGDMPRGDMLADDALAATVDEIANRLGPDRLWRAAPHESHIPERATTRIPPLSLRPPRRAAWEGDPSRERPVRLFRRPEPIEAVAPVPDDPPILFRWRGTTHRVRAADGPERIGPEWWRRRGADPSDGNRVRDYYRVEDADGARFWIFRAGLMGEEIVPRWYLHGLFG